MGMFFVNQETELLKLRDEFEAQPTFERYAKYVMAYNIYYDDYKEAYGVWPTLLVREVDVYAPKKEWQKVAEAFNALPWEEKKKYYEEVE